MSTKKMHIYFGFLLILFLSEFNECGKIKMVDEPFSFNNAHSSGGGVARGDYNQEPNLILRYIPEKPSGPQYLIDNLFGKCFSRVFNNYKYELCPFNNVTQREQAYRWNAFNGILGIWKEWLIVGNNFTSMYMVHGDPCAGNLERETKVNMTCGKENNIVSVKEPSMCKYEILFKTPYACPTDVFFVYPILSDDGKIKWQEIETDYVMRITTKKGYLKAKKNLLFLEGLSVRDDLRKNTGSEPAVVVKNNKEIPAELPLKSTGIFAQDFLSVSSRFTTKQQCDVEYTKLLNEVELLREQLRLVNLKKIGEVSFGVYGSTKEHTIQETIQKLPLDPVPDDTKLVERKIEDRNKRGDLGIHDKNTTKHSKPILEQRKLERPQDKTVTPVVSNNSLSQVKKMIKKRRKGDDGILDEKNYPMRNLMGRLEYDANIISRLKVHGRLRDVQRKLGDRL